jgi:UV DNA damage repair endonuclease
MDTAHPRFDLTVSDNSRKADIALVLNALRTQSTSFNDATVQSVFRNISAVPKQGTRRLAANDECSFKLEDLGSNMAHPAVLDYRHSQAAQQTDTANQASYC